jgi:ankyrin repeat protein
VIHTQGVAELAKSNFIYTASVTSISTGNLNMLDVILSKTGSSIDITGRHGNNLLIFAAMWGQFDVVQYLLQRGADVSIVNEFGETAYSLAKQNGHHSVAVLLRSFGAR